MSETKTERKSVMIETDTHKKLSVLSQSSGMSMSVILGYLVDQCEKLDMLDPSWIDKLRDQTFIDVKQGLSDDRLERALTVERARAVTRAKLTAWTKYIDCLPAEERRQYLEKLLGAGGLVPTGQDFIDQLSLWSLAKINNEPRMVRTNADGTLAIGPSMVPCNVGYHEPNAFCKGNCWQTCEIKSRERRQSRLEFDPTKAERDKQYLASRGIKVDRV